MSAVEELMKEVAAAQKNELRRMNIESEVKHLVAARMVEGTAKSRVETRTWRWVSLGTAAAAVAAVLLVVVSLHRNPFLTVSIDTPSQIGHIGQTGDLIAPPAGQAMAAVFSDGSRIVVSESSHARIDSVDANGATVTLDDGHLDASVIHRPQTRWEVRAGDYRIHVTGTRFSTAWNRHDRALTVRLYEGSVVVTGPGIAASGARVRTGHVLHATAQGATLASAEPETEAATMQPQIVPISNTQGSEPVMDPASAAVAASAVPEALEPSLAPSAPEAPAPAVGPSTRVHRWVASRSVASRAAASSSAPIASAPVAAPAPALAPAPAQAAAPAPTHASAAQPLPGAPVPMVTTWRALARRAQYHQALTLALAEGFDRDCDQLRGDDLVLLGDVARLGGDIRHADQAYRAALRRFPDLDRPAFALGVMAFESRHDYRDAASWLSRYLHDHPNGPLATEAAGRLLEAWDLAGDTARARETARNYLRDHPTGPHKALARRLAGP
jgi:ferric-dicitrate binding protein FerR (iron transport regulator)